MQTCLRSSLRADQFPSGLAPDGGTWTVVEGSPTGWRYFYCAVYSGGIAPSFTFAALPEGCAENTITWPRGSPENAVCWIRMEVIQEIFD